MSSQSINKIHVTNSTGLSLHDRFTALATEPIRRRSRSRSRSRSRARQPVAPRVDPATSMANARLLRQLARKHTVQTALKLKRRSLRAAGAGLGMKRGAVKSLRVGPKGRPLSTSTRAKIATMRADLISNGRGRALRRSNSRLDVKRLGTRRPLVGGAAERVALRRLNRLGAQTGRVARARSRSRVRAPIADAANGRQVRQRRSMSRGRAPAPDRSRSRARGRVNTPGNTVSIKSRLGVRPGAPAQIGGTTNARRGRKNRAASISRRGPATGRIQKRAIAQAQKAGGVGGRLSRARGRAIVQNVTARSASRTRKGSVGPAKQRNQQQSARGSAASVRGVQQRGRNAQRNGRGGARNAQRNAVNGKAKPKVNAAKNGPQQTRRGRSRSRAAGRGGRDGRNLGKNQRKQVNKDDLDKELDQYMATTKTENDMDYLLN